MSEGARSPSVRNVRGLRAVVVGLKCRDGGCGEADSGGGGGNSSGGSCGARA